MDNKIKGECSVCGGEIPVADCICKHCLNDLEKEAIYGQ